MTERERHIYTDSENAKMLWPVQDTLPLQPSLLHRHNFAHACSWRISPRWVQATSSPRPLIFPFIKSASNLVPELATLSRSRIILQAPRTCALPWSKSVQKLATMSRSHGRRQFNGCLATIVDSDLVIGLWMRRDVGPWVIICACVTIMETVTHISCNMGGCAVMLTVSLRTDVHLQNKVRHLRWRRWSHRVSESFKSKQWRW